MYILYIQTYILFYDNIKRKLECSSVITQNIYTSKNNWVESIFKINILVFRDLGIGRVRARYGPRATFRGQVAVSFGVGFG